MSHCKSTIHKIYSFQNLRDELSSSKHLVKKKNQIPNQISFMNAKVWHSEICNKCQINSYITILSVGAKEVNYCKDLFFQWLRLQPNIWLGIKYCKGWGKCSKKFCGSGISWSFWGEPRIYIP